MPVQTQSEQGGRSPSAVGIVLSMERVASARPCGERLEALPEALQQRATRHGTRGAVGCARDLGDRGTARVDDSAGLDGESSPHDLHGVVRVADRVLSLGERCVARTLDQHSVAEHEVGSILNALPERVEPLLHRHPGRAWGLFRLRRKTLQNEADRFVHGRLPILGCSGLVN